MTIPGPLLAKTALITGATGLIGQRIAHRLALAGSTCILVSRTPATLAAALDTLPASSGQPHSVLAGDVGDMGFWKGVDRGLKIDILVNAAGVTHASPLFVTSPERVEACVQTNLMGTMWGCQVLGKRMMRQKDGGCIINVASLLGLKGGVGSVAYAASKAGVIGLTRALAAEVGKHKIRVNVIIPGYIETEMTKGMTPKAREQALESIPMGLFGEADDIADAALFLATNKYANNCVLNLDGGLSAT